MDVVSVGMAAADAKKKYQPAVPNTAVLFGTSLEAQGDAGCDLANPANPNGHVNGRGWLNWFKMYAGQRIDLVKNSGVSGNTSTQMLARYQADVLAYNPGWVFIGGPVNDAPSAIPAATTISNLTTMYQAFRGRRVVQLNLAPRADYDTTQKRADVSAVNEWLRTVHLIFPHVTVIDIWRILANPATGSPASGLTLDGTHWLDHSAALVGKEAARIIGGELLASMKPSVGLLDPRNALGGVGFNASGTGWTIVAATGRTLTFPADDDTPGTQAQIVIAAVSDGVESAVRYVENIASARFAVGDVIQASVRVRWSGLVATTSAFVCHPFLHFRYRKTDDTYPTDAYGMFVPSNAYAVPTRFPSSGDVVIKTAPFTVPAGTNRIYLDVGWLGASDGTIKLSEPQLERIVTPA